jgi:methylated-DNA-[protein]-cysteine S-methyltransferase
MPGISLTAAITSPIGRLGLTVEGGRLIGVTFHEAGAWPDAGQDPLLQEVASQLEAYFAGRLRHFDLPLDLRGTTFQGTVWSALRTIPYGETWSYRDLAAHIGRPAAVRAVGAANGRNPIPIIVPCHRVIGSNGALTGFGGGLPLKARLLALERGPRPAAFSGPPPTGTTGPTGPTGTSGPRNALSQVSFFDREPES